MPEPKDAKLLLTATERERLINRIPDRNMSETYKEKHKNSIYHNDMVVRDKVVSWLKKSEDILFALEHLPTRKLKKGINDDDVYQLFNVVLRLLDVLDFAPVESVGGQAVIAKHAKTDSDKLKDVWMRPATEIDFKRNFVIRRFLQVAGLCVAELPIIEKYMVKNLSEMDPTFRSYHEREEKKIKYRKEIEDYDKKLESDPNNIDLLLEKAGRLAVIGQFEDSVNYYNKIIELNPSEVRAWASKIISLKSMNRHLEAREEALTYFNKMLEIDPSNIEVWLSKTSFFAEEASRNRDKALWREALKSLNEAIRLEPTNENLLLAKGVILGNLRKEIEAIKCSDEVLIINPENAAAWVNKGIALKSLNRTEDALKCYEAAINIDPKDAGAWFNKGITLLELNEPEKAKACFKEALEIDHSVIDQMVAKGEALLRGGHKNEGEDYLAAVKEIKELVGL